jgi:quinol monooxygenase YgiN
MEQFVFVRLHVREGNEQAVMDALHDATTSSRGEPGCRDFHTFRSKRDPRLFLIHSRWRNEAAFQQHALLPHTVRFLERVDALLPCSTSLTKWLAPKCWNESVVVRKASWKSRSTGEDLRAQKPARPEFCASCWKRGHGDCIGGEPASETAYAYP